MTFLYGEQMWPICGAQCKEYKTGNGESFDGSPRDFRLAIMDLLYDDRGFWCGIPEIPIQNCGFIIGKHIARIFQ